MKAPLKHILIPLLALVLVACGGGDNESTDSAEIATDSELITDSESTGSGEPTEDSDSTDNGEQTDSELTTDSESIGSDEPTEDSDSTDNGEQTDSELTTDSESTGSDEPTENSDSTDNGEQTDSELTTDSESTGSDEPTEDSDSTDNGEQTDTSGTVDFSDLILPPGFSSSELRVHHASPDAPTVSVFLDDETTASIRFLGYGTSSQILDVEAEYYSARIESNIPTAVNGGSGVETIPATLAGPLDLALFGGTTYEVLALNTFDSFETITVSRSRAYDREMARVTVLHGAHSAPEVDVHVTAPDAALSSDTVLGTFEFRGVLGPVEIDPGTYQIRVTLAGTDTMVYDSGELELNAGLDVFAAAIVNPSITDSEGKSPIALSLALDESESSILYSADDGADLRVIHNSADAPPVDVVVNNTFDSPLIEDLAFPDFTSPYVNVPADTYNVKVTAANTMSAVIDTDLELENGGIYSVYALNALTAIEPLVLADNPISLATSPRSIATYAKVRLIHGSTNAGSVDVALEPLDVETDIVSRRGLSFKQYSLYQAYPEGSYNVIVYARETGTPLIGPLQIDVENGGVYTILVRDGADLEGLGVTLLDDFVTE